MKRLILVIVVLLLIPTITFAEVKDVGESSTKKIDAKIIKRVKDIFNIGDDFSNFNIESYGKADKSFFLQWYGEENHVHVGVNDKGDIISYDKSEPKGEIKAEANVEEFKKLSTDYFKKIDSELVNSYKFKKGYLNVSSGRIIIEYQRFENNIPVLNDNANFEYSLKNKELLNYDRSLESVTLKSKDFPKAGNVLSTEKAIELFKKEQPLKYTYLLIPDEYSRVEEQKYISKGVYKTLGGNYPIDAVDGTLIKKDNNDIYTDEAKSDNGAMKMEQVELKKIEGLKSIKEAEKKARELVPSEYKLESYSTTMGRNKKYIHSLNFSNDKGGAQVVYQADNLDLLSYYNYAEIEENKITEEDVKKASRDFIKKYGDGVEEKLDLDNPVVEINEYGGNIKYYLLEGGVPVEFNGVEISVVGKNVITWYGKTIDDVKYSNNSAELPIGKAYEIALKDFKLAYKYIDNKPRLVYTFLESDPIVGVEEKALINRNGEKLNTVSTAPEEVAKSYKNLVDLGIFVPGKNLKDELTHREYLNLLDQLNRYGTFREYDKGIEIGSKKLTKEVLDSKIDYRNALYYSVKFLTLDETLEKLNTEIFNPNLFKNVKGSSMDSMDKYGYIAYGLGIFKDKDYNPTAILKHEDALKIISQIIISPL